MTRPSVHSMAALALVTALMAHLKKGGELSSADANSILERASSLLNVLSLSFNDVTSRRGLRDDPRRAQDVAGSAGKSSLVAMVVLQGGFRGGRRGSGGGRPVNPPDRFCHPTLDLGHRQSELVNSRVFLHLSLPIDLTKLVRDVLQRIGNPHLSFCLAGSGLGLAWVEVGLEELLDPIFHSTPLP